MVVDKNILELMKLNLKSEIKMSVNGTTNIYRFGDNPNENEGFELYAQDDKKHENSIYGLSSNGVWLTDFVLSEYLVIV